MIKASDEFRTAFAAACLRAENHIDDDIAPQRLAATRFYNGEPFGDEQDGRSQIVMTEVRDTVSQMMPTLLRVFAGTERAVVFTPAKPGQEQMAEEATLAVPYWFFSECDGFRVLHDACKDALVRKLGIITWRWESREEVVGCTYEDVTPSALLKLSAQPDVIGIETRKTGVVGTDDATGEPADLVRAAVKKRVRISRPLVEAVPPDEFIFTPGTHSLGNTLLVGRRYREERGRLEAWGIDPELLADPEVAVDEEKIDTTGEREARNRTTWDEADGDGRTGATARVRVFDCYFRYDADGDGISELLRVIALGSSHMVARVELADEVPYAVGCPDPEAHTLWGLSLADITADLQRIKSYVMRGVLDSLANSLHPRTAIVEGQVNIDDVLNVETGAVIRQRAPGMVQELASPFVGGSALPVIGYLDAVREQRTGLSRASQGLDADVMQSTTAKAVDATVTGAQERKELITRVLAEMFVKPVFRGLLRLLVKYAQGETYIPIGDTLRAVDPATWDLDMRVTCTIGMARGTDEDRLTFLAAVAGKQEQILTTIGPDNPMVTLKQLRHTYAQMLMVKGYKDASLFFLDPDQQQQPAPKQPAQDPAMVVAQMQFQIETAKLELQRQKQQAEDDRERDRLAADIQLRTAETQAKYAVQIDLARLKAEIDAPRNPTGAQSAGDAANLAGGTGNPQPDPVAEPSGGSQAPA